MIPGGPRGRRGPSLRRVLSRCRDERGTSLVELALVLPILLVLLLGMIDFGKAVNYWIDDTHLANLGARYAAVNNNPGTNASPQVSLQQYILNQVTTAEQAGTSPGTQADAHSAQVCINFLNPDGSTNSTPKIGDSVTVTVKYSYSWLHFLTAQAGFSTATVIGGRATMRLEANPTHFSAGCTPTTLPT